MEPGKRYCSKCGEEMVMTPVYNHGFDEKTGKQNTPTYHARCPNDGLFRRHDRYDLFHYSGDLWATDFGEE